MPVSLEQHAAEAAMHGVAPEVIELLTYLFSEVVDGRNDNTTDGVRRALGREARDFSEYARRAAATGIWTPGAQLLECPARTSDTSLSEPAAPRREPASPTGDG